MDKQVLQITGDIATGSINIATNGWPLTDARISKWLLSETLRIVEREIAKAEASASGIIPARGTLLRELPPPNPDQKRDGA